MKKTLIAFIALFIFSGMSFGQKSVNVKALFAAEKIGVPDKSSFKAVSEKSVKKFFEKRLKEQGESTKITSFKIMEFNGNKGLHYMLTGFNDNQSVKIGIGITLNEDIFTITGKTTVTCKGCSTYGCNPGGTDGNYYCFPQCENGNCEKTVTMTEESDISSEFS